MAEKLNESNNVSKMADKGGMIMNPYICKINPELPHHDESDPLLLTCGIAQKKKSQFRITSVSTHNTNDGEMDSADDLDESHTEDISSELLDVSKNTDIDQDPSSEDTISNDNNDDINNYNNAVPYQQSRFKVVKIESTEPFKRGRWICMDFLDPPVQDIKSDLTEREIGSGNSSAGSSVHFVPGENLPSENPLAAHGLDGTVNHPTIDNQQIYTAAQSLPTFPNVNQNIEYTHITSQTATQPLTISSNVQQTIPQNISAPAQVLQQNPGQQNVLTQGVSHPVTTMPPTIAQNVPVSQNTPVSISTVLQPGMGISTATNIPASVIPSVISQTNPTGMTMSGLPQGLSQSTPTTVQPSIHPQGLQQSTIPVSVLPQTIPTSVQSSILQQQTISQSTQQILPQGLPQSTTSSLFTQGVTQTSANIQPLNMGQQIINPSLPTSVPHNVPTPASNIIQMTNSGHPINHPQGLVGAADGVISSHPQSSAPCSDAGVGTPIQPFSVPVSSTSDVSVGVLTPPQAENVISAKDSIDEETESTSGSSTVAIDNKIEQAMDLVKSHLMFAVREEVEVLKERITELMERIGQLEYENNILKANAPPETLAQLTTTKPHSQAPPPSS